jgi:hypothetical protein
MTKVLSVVAAAVVLAGSASGSVAQELPWDSVAARIVTALQVDKGERVLLRYDPGTYGALEPVVRRQLEAAGARVESLTYAPAADLAERLARTDIYIWLPAGSDANTPPAERAILATWRHSTSTTRRSAQSSGPLPTCCARPRPA